MLGFPAARTPLDAARLRIAGTMEFGAPVEAPGNGTGTGRFQHGAAGSFYRSADGRRRVPTPRI
jgi:hypothetical protein